MNSVKNKRREISFAAILALITISTWWFATRNSEPILSGKPVTYWINHLPPVTKVIISSGKLGSTQIVHFSRNPRGPLEAGHPLEEAVLPSLSVREPSVTHLN